MKNIIVFLALLLPVFTAEAGDSFYVNKIKLVSLFTKKLNQPFNFKSFQGEWLSPSRSDQIYPGSCDPLQLSRDSNIETREQFDLAVSIERYRREGGPHMNFSSRIVGGKSMLLDGTNHYGIAPFKGSLALWTTGWTVPTYCVVIQPSEVSLLTSQSFAKPAKEFLICKSASYSYLYDTRKECVIEEADPEDEYSETEIDTQSPRCIEIGLKNPCTHYNVFVRNH